MAVVAELVHVGLLRKEDYQKYLYTFVSSQEINAKTCEILFTLIKACEDEGKFGNDESLRKTYFDLLQCYLFPHLAAIIVKLESELPNHFEHFKLVDRQAEKGNNISKATESGGVLNVARNVSQNAAKLSAKFNLDVEQKATEIGQLTLAPKIIKLIVYVVNRLSQSERPGDVKSNFEDPSREVQLSNQRIYSLIGEIFDSIGESLKKCGRDSFTKCNQHRVKVLSLIFTHFLVDCDWLSSRSVGLRDPMKNVIEVALTVIQDSHDPDVTALLLNLTIRPFIEKLTKERLYVINKLWLIVVSFFVVEDGFVVEETNPTGFLILCFMAEYIYDKENFYKVRSSDTFYVTIQYGLMHCDALTRKRSQFILKRTVDFCMSSGFRHVSSNYLSWKEANQLCFQNAWNDFFLLNETLEEKQSHVIWPVLEKVDNFIEMISAGQFHVSWILVILKRVFDHDNKNIKHWGVTKLLNIKLSKFMLVNGVLAFINSHLLTVLSDYSLYGQEPGQSHHGVISSVGEQFGNFLGKVVNCLNSNDLADFMCSFLQKIFDGRMWGGIPLFYVIRSLSVIPSTGLWDNKMVQSALVKFEACLNTHEIVVRSASQCNFLKAIFKHLNSQTSLIELCNIVRHFRRKESWCRGTVIWKMLLESLDSFEKNYESATMLSSVHNALHSSLGCQEVVIDPQDAALGIILFLEKTRSVECEAERKNKILMLLQPVTTFLADCHLRPYLNQQKYRWTLQLLSQMLEILNDIPQDSLDTEDIAGNYLSCLQESISCITQLFPIQVRSFSHPDDLEVMSLYLDLFAQCHQTEGFILIVNSQYCDILTLCQRLLNDESDVKVAYGIILLEYLLSFDFGQSKNSATQEIAKLTINKVLHDVEEITGRRQIEGCSASESTAKLQMEVTRCCWCCVELLVNKSALWTNGELLLLRKEVEVKVLSVLMDSISIAGRANVLSVFNICVQLAPIIIKEHMWHEVTELMWKSAAEFKKCCDLYRSLVRCVCDTLFHHQAILQEDCCSSITHISQKLMDTAEGVQGIASHMARSLVQSFAQVVTADSFVINSCGNVIDLMVVLVRFGPVFRKQYKIIRETTNYIQNCKELYSTNLALESVESDQQARAVILRFFLTLDKNQPQDRALAAALFRSLKHHYTECTRERRDFANSQKHRYKTRLLQAFMLLLPLLSEEECRDAIEWLCQGLIKDHQQPSVRYMQEWSVALIVIFYPALFPAFFEHFIQGTKERVGCVGSFLASLTHIACTSKDGAVLCRSVEYTLPWCMGQHFNTRLYAQVSLRKIWQHCESMNVSEVLDKYSAVHHCLKFVAEQGNAVRNTVNMLNDFYFKVFHPIQHYTLETILYDLPCLSLLSDEEWLSVDSLLHVVDVSILPIHSDLPLHNADNVLAKSLPAPWVVKAAGETSLIEDQDVVEKSRTVVQKKITPWKSMMPELSCSLDLPHLNVPNLQRGDLIVVASLIDKAPNLGGLCRTCEVFSVKEYVIPSLAIQEDHNFNSLSLTAQQWVPMKEVKPENLPAYLRMLQAEGYTLVAAEQTANSYMLSDYVFPERTVVVLGNEREGIPCDLLQLLDVCVEIPQTGIIRSLNVHVSAALFVWEYTRQHLNKFS